MPTPDLSLSSNGAVTETPLPNGSLSSSPNGPAELSPEALDLLGRLRRGELVTAPDWVASTPPPDTPGPVASGTGPPAVAYPTPVPLRPRLSDRLPPYLRDAVVDPTARGAAGLGVVALLAALVAVVLTLRAAPSSVPISAAPSFTGAAPSTSGPAGSSAKPSPSAAGVVVDVAGKVRRPGVVTVAAGGRVADAVRLAGGLLPGTDTSGMSMARKLTDGEQILVTGEPGPAPVAGGGSVSAPPTSATTGTGASSAASAAAGGPLDLNTATQAQLEELPGVGPVLAQRILAYRTERGGFTAVDQLTEVKGLGGKTGQELMSLVRVG